MNRSGSQPNRRDFLSKACAGAAVIAGHAQIGATGAEQTRTEKRGANQTRILALELQTGATLARMKEFYHEALGLRILEDRAERLTIAAGTTRLTFVPAEAPRARPFYHFAFNIPENKIRAARDWQRQRTALLPIPVRLRDSDYPDDVVNYSHWNAHSVFFCDPAGNVVEHIARHDLRNAADGPFTSRDILCASEIAFVVDDVTATAANLREAVGVTTYRGGSDDFRALGDENGLLLVMRRGRVISFDSPERKAVEVFRTTARVHGARTATQRVAGFPYEIHVDSD